MRTPALVLVHYYCYFFRSGGRRWPRFSVGFLTCTFGLAVGVEEDARALDVGRAPQTEVERHVVLVDVPLERLVAPDVVVRAERVRERDAPQLAIDVPQHDGRGEVAAARAQGGAARAVDGVVVRAPTGGDEGQHLARVRELSVRARQEVHVVQSAPAPEGWVLAVRGEYVAGQKFDTDPGSSIFRNATLANMSFAMWRHVGTPLRLGAELRGQAVRRVPPRPRAAAKGPALWESQTMTWITM